MNELDRTFPTRRWRLGGIAFACSWMATWLLIGEMGEFGGGRGVGAVTGPLVTPPSGTLWRFESSTLFAGLGLGAVLGLLWLAWRGERAPSGRRWPTLSPRLVDLLVGMSAFVLAWRFADQSRSGDFARVIFDIANGVKLLAAEPLSPWLLHASTRVGVELGLDPMDALRGGLALWGGLGAVAIVHVARACVRVASLTSADESVSGAASGAGVLGAALALGASGASALLFAHVETYTFAAVLVLFAVSQALHALADDAQQVAGSGVDPTGVPSRARRRLALACGLWIAAAAFHMQMLCVGPAFGYAVLVVDRRETDGARTVLRAVGVALRRGRWSRGLAFAFAAALILGAIQALAAANPPPYPQHFGGGDARMFVPVSGWFSSRHLGGFVNEWMLMAPGAAWLWLTAVAMRSAGTRLPTATHARTFLALMATGWLCFSFLWNPDLGAWHDWDLFAAGGWWCTAWAVLWTAERGRGGWSWLWIVVVLNLARSIPFIVANHLG